MLSERTLLRLGRRGGQLRLEVSWRGGRAGERRVDELVLELTLPPALAPRRQRLGYLGTRCWFKRLIPNGPFVEWLTDPGVVMVAFGWRGARRERR